MKNLKNVFIVDGFAEYLGNLHPRFKMMKFFIRGKHRYTEDMLWYGVLNAGRI